MSDEGGLRNMSDTENWVAVYRALETERRPDALFHDPFARRLAGERGARIAEEASFARQNAADVNTCADAVSSFDSHETDIRKHIDNDRRCRLNVDAHPEVEATIVVPQQRQRYRHVTSIGDEGDRNSATDGVARTCRPRHVGAATAGREDEHGVLDAG